MAQVKNIIVGAASLFLGQSEGVQPLLPAFVNGTPYATTLAADTADFRDVGFTNNGLSLTYTPTYTDVTVDQLKDAALIFASALTVEVATELSEATLVNLKTVWGQHDASLSFGANGDTPGNTDVIGVAGGALGDYPVERSLVAVGNAPRSTTSTTAKKERIYHGRRVVSINATTVANSRTAMTTFPVTFRLLPDPTYSGSEYGKIIDRTI